jgi:hypothetical protein
VKIHLKVFCVVMPCNVVVGYQPEDGGSMDLRNVDILPQHYRASQLRSRHEFCASFPLHVYILYLRDLRNIQSKGYNTSSRVSPPPQNGTAL